MRLTLKKLLKDQKGFTLVEIMMAVVLVAILAGIGISQFTDFGKETKDASTKQALGILRDGIQKQYGQMRLRCGITGTGWPLLADLVANDITTTGGATTTATACGTDKVTNASDRKFFSGSIPENPWSDVNAASKNSIAADTAAEADFATNNCANALFSAADTDGGWCYNETTGTIRANSANSTGGVVEALF
jgi:type IV pilus assembly protein PilA